MASYCTDAFNFHKALDGGSAADLVPVGATQAAAAPIGNVEVVQIRQGVSNGGLILPSVLGLDASGIVYITNDGPNSINIYPAVGEVINALAANAAIALVSGAVAVCVRIPRHLSTTHGRTAVATAGWSVGICPAVT